MLILRHLFQVSNKLTVRPAHQLRLIPGAVVFTNENIYFENRYDEQRKFTNESYSI
jgi:hypothetical protein